MSKASSIGRTISYAVIFSLLLLAFGPGFPQMQQSSSISGRILLSDTKMPVAGAIVKAAEIESRTIYESNPTSDNGSYELAGLTEGRYDIAVQIDDGLYVIGRVLDVAANESYALSLALQENPQEEQKEGEKTEQETEGKEGEEGKATTTEGEKEKERRLGFWENPLTASLTLVGIAAIVGFGIDKSTEEEERPSPF